MFVNKKGSRVTTPLPTDVHSKLSRILGFETWAIRVQEQHNIESLSLNFAMLEGKQASVTSEVFDTSGFQCPR